MAATSVGLKLNRELMKLNVGFFDLFLYNLSIHEIVKYKLSHF